MTGKKEENNWVFVNTIECQQIKFQLNTKLVQFDDDFSPNILYAIINIHVV